MASDPLQIALEHHRAGRLTQAEAGYRALLRTDPDHADAAHWLGVLVCQAGQLDEAVSLLRRATDLRPDDAAFRHNLGEAYLQTGRADDAIAALERAAALRPGQAETLMAIGRARLVRREAGDAVVAAAAFRAAQAAGADSAELHHDLGVAHLAAGRPDDAISAFRAALAKKADHAAAYYHLAAAHRARGEGKEVRKCLNKALEIDPGHARAWYALAALDAEAGNLDQAAALFRKAIRVKADYAAAYDGLSRVLRQAGRAAEADAVTRQAAGARSTAPSIPLPASVADLERRLTPAPEAAGLHFTLAALANLAPPAHVPAGAVADLFDRYAPQFDAHLCGKLEYRAPELIAAAVAAHPPARPADVMDLGCGTGLCGRLLRPLAATLAGVDLSPEMVEKAKLLGIYDRLEVGELVATLRQSPAAFDLLTAADVFVYLGDLAPTFEAAAAALRPGGLLVFTVEAGDGDRFRLQPDSRRYAHSRPYLQRLAGMYGFEVLAMDAAVLRLDFERPVEGYVVVLRKPV